MFSYLEVVKSLVNEDIYQLGIKEYLVGNVLEYISLDLIDWRKYEVKGRSIYEVTFPLLHKLTPRTSWGRSSQHLKDHAKCTCEYFESFGTCKHIVAVCAALEKEIKPTRDGEEVVSTPLLSRVLEVSDRSKVNEWYNEIVDFLELPEEDDMQNASLRRVYEPVREAFSSHLIDSFVQSVSKYLDDSISSYPTQKRYVKLLLFTRAWLVAGHEWWKLFLPYLQKIQDTLQIQFWKEFWKEWPFYQQSLAESKELLLEAAEAMSEENKIAVLSLLEQDNVPLADRLEFAQFSCYYPFVIEYLPQLDITHLLQLLPKLPEHQYEIEYALSEQVRTLSDFLTTKEEPVLINALQEWREAVPDSDVLLQVMNDLKKLHKRRKKLLQKLEILS